MMRLIAWAALGAGVLAGGQAGAHAILIDSSPAPLGHVAAGHVQLTLRYNSRIDAERSKLTLTHGDDAQRLPVAAAGRPDTLQAAADLAPGDYVIKWQVLATDGHITRGDVPFTADPRAGSPATGASAK
jgi:hypothetical protein